MTHGHAHEEAEHAGHHAADPFDRRVALSMVVIAAVLAAVKVLGHRTHNDTLAYQVKAGVAQTSAANLRSFFQSKRQRIELAALQAAQLELLVPLRAANESQPASDGLPERDGYVKRATADLKEEFVEKPDEQAEKLVAACEKRYQQLCQARYPPKRAEEIARLEMNASRYRLEADAINGRADAEMETAKKYQKVSVHKHHQADYFDLGELGVELALVLSSVAILTKRNSYWYAGIAVGLAGLVAVVIGFLV